MRAALLLLLLLPALLLPGACTTRTTGGGSGEALVYASSPEVAQQCPDTPVSGGGQKSRLIGLITGEWARFGGWRLIHYPDRAVMDPVGSMVEDDRIAYACLIKFWAATGEDGFTPYLRCIAPWSDRTYRRCPWHAAWSAAFVSWAMNTSGANAFPPHETHSVYLTRLIAQAEADPATPLLPHDPYAYAPQPGDLVCRGRSGQHPRRLSEIVAGNPMHCDIVVAAEGSQLRMIGGNVYNAVTETVIQTDNGYLPQGGWAAVVENRYAW